MVVRPTNNGRPRTKTAQTKTAQAGRSSRSERPGKQAIIKAAIEVMGEHGYDGSSIRDIAANAGMSVAALYYHFSSKQDMLFEFLNTSYDYNLDMVERALLASPPDAPSRLRAIMKVHVEPHLHDAWTQLASVVAHSEYRRLEEPYLSTIVAKRERKRQTIARVIQQGVDEGVFTTPDPDEAARAIWILGWSVGSWYSPETGHTKAEIVELYQEYALRLAGYADPAPDGREPVRAGRRAGRSNN